MFTRPIIAVTMGDPAGVGPELCVRLLETELQARVVVFGSLDVLQRAARTIGRPSEWTACDLSGWPDTQAQVVDVTAVDSLAPGTVSAATGRAAVDCIEAAIEAALARTVDAVATGPIHKEAMHAAGVLFPGHTELFAARTGAERSCMMLTSPELTCSFVTTHVGYRDVPALLTRDRVLDVIQLTDDALRRLHGRRPELAVCGLNPHAGEHGLFGGGEEEEIIQPAIDAARRKGFAVDGPLPPDTAFLPGRRARTDGFICMYHDQGHIPLKALAFDRAVNVTLGLPIIRTSVDHGTALDIAWKGSAQASSLIEAVKLAARLVRP